MTGPTQIMAFYVGNNQYNLHGAGYDNDPNGTFETVFQSNNYGNTSAYVMCLRGAEINVAGTIVFINGEKEHVVNTAINSNNINGRVLVNTDTSGNKIGTALWQQRLASASNYQIVKRSYIRPASNNFTLAFTDTNEVSLTASLLPGYDCVNCQVLQYPDKSYKLALMGSPTVGAELLDNLFVLSLNSDFTPNGVFMNVAPQLAFYSGTTFEMLPLAQNGLKIFISSATPGPLNKVDTITLFANNTADGSPIQIDANSYTQYSTTITAWDDGRTTYGYDCGGNVCYQTVSDSPWMVTPNNITLPENTGGQWIPINGFSVAPTTYPRTQITVTIASPIPLGTFATIPANAQESYADGLYTLTTTGSNCETVANNLLGCFGAQLAPYDRNNFVLDFTQTDSSGLPAFTAQVPAYIIPTDYVPVININALPIGQDSRARFDLNITTQDNAPAANITVPVTNYDTSVADVRLIDPVTEAVLKTGLTSFNYQDHLDGKIVVDQLGSNTKPNLALSAYAYNGQPCLLQTTNVAFYTTPQPLIFQVTYTAQSKTDTTPLLLDATNFEVQDSNSNLVQVEWNLNYGANAHCRFAPVGHAQTTLTQFNQQGVNNGNTTYFIPDGSGESPQGVMAYVDDGYAKSQLVNIIFKFSVAPQPVQNGGSGPSILKQFEPYLYSAAGTAAGIFVGMMYADQRRHVKDAFANMVKHQLKLNYINFSDADGKDFRNFIDKITSATGLKAEIEELVPEYNWFTGYFGYGGAAGAKLTNYAKIFALYIDVYKEDIEKSHFMTKLYYRVLGKPIQADALDKESNGQIVGKIATSIMQALSAQTAKDTLPQQQEAGWFPTTLQRWATTTKLPAMKKASPTKSEQSGGSMGSISLDILNPSPAATDNSLSSSASTNKQIQFN